MEVKKTTKADLNKRTFFFLQIALIIVLLMVYFSVQWKSYEIPKVVKNNKTEFILEEEAIPITSLPTPPPPKLVIPDVIETVPNDPEIKEDPIPTTEVDPSEIARIEDITEVKKEVKIETYPFILIEDVPIFPGCENLKNNEDRKNCMSEKISKLINKEFNAELGGQLGLTGINRINVMFKIDVTGNIIDVQTRAPHPKLEIEAKRVIETLPKMTPGRQRGIPVIVQYSIPIIFKVQD